MPGKRSIKDVAFGSGDLGTPGSTPGRPKSTVARMQSQGVPPARAKPRGSKRNNGLIPETFDREFYVEHILDKRIIMPDGKIQYLVKWENYTVEESTWEPEEHLTHAIGKVRHYEEKAQAEAAAQIVRLDARAPEVPIGTDPGPAPKKKKKEDHPKCSTSGGRGRGRGKAAAASSSEATTPPISSETGQLQQSAAPQHLHWVVLDPATMEEVKEPQAILGFARDGEECSYVVKWKRSLDKELVPSAVCVEKFPGLIVEYWENIHSK